MRYRVELTCDYRQRTTVVTFHVDGTSPLDAVARAESELAAGGEHRCEHIVAVHVHALNGDSDRGEVSR